MNLVKCTGTLTIMGILISFNVTLLTTVYRNIEMIDWHWQSINHSSYLIYFWYNFFDSANETNVYKIKLRRLYWPLFIVVLQAVNELPSQHWTERAKIVWWYCTPLKIRLPDKFQRASFPCTLGKHCLGNFLVQCCLRRIWTKYFNIPMQCCPSMVDTTLYGLFSP